MSDNPSAFPRPGFEQCAGMQDGMTLRDYFAAQADVAVYNPLETLTKRLGRAPEIAEMANYISAIRMVEARAMIAARKGDA